MRKVKVDLPEKSISVKQKRELLRIEIDMATDSITVYYTETEYTGVEGQPNYSIRSNVQKSYTADLADWAETDAGIAIQAGVEATLSQENPNA